ncbi:IctB family putative bicarbonate transporter [Thermosynechococcus sp. QKsg1]|uniref:IctB family putative bicarbonate transporter n=1 Tax=unclassified Thermosynechococcus TaxID=2622553 RepID=UPI00122E3A43|nr:MULTISPECIES: IctB family putative bicarbonate transporter [unclassified Thermosynechococcus]QEQ00698.1 putative bicarbonate transporter, IctB family [Thermosynechococcus sp. CL-1]WJI24941.1 IctB family putative bicarbonate transporter [Thermosynechococcus sp. B0]WJI27460.1 IctB family putative bicarbonate transporter [Thermosynechococcus sp. B1]WJI29992.1 IctB family putative bicarbonate transporter [Thermosynechococcus sp. B3]WKT84577.1 IctB family putative bicarbonate transporter [Thermo
MDVLLRRLDMEGWRSHSGVGRLLGLLQGWQEKSWLGRWLPHCAALLVGLVLVLAPLMPSGMIGMLLAAGGGFWLLWTLAGEREGRWSGVHLLVLLYWGIALLATVLSPVPRAAMVGLSKLTLYLLFFALAERVMRNERWRSRLLTVYLLTALLVSVEGIRQWIFGAEPLATWTDPESALANVTRVYSFLGNPNLLAGYLLPSVPLSAAAIAVWRGWLPKLLAVVMLGMNTASLILTFSRGGWLGLVAATIAGVGLLGIWFWPRLPLQWRRWGVPTVGGLAIALCIGAIVSVAPLRERAASIFVARGDSSNNFRINVWTAVQQMIWARPWLGIGPGNVAFNQIYPLYQVNVRFTALSAYSIFLEILVEVGVMGFSVFLWLLAVLADRAWRCLQALRTTANPQGFWLMGAVASMVGMLTHGLVDTIWFRPEVATLWWLMVAIVASFAPLADRTENTAANGLDAEPST